MACDDLIKKAFNRDYDDVQHPKVFEFLKTFYEKSEKIGDMMEVLRMPRTIPTFRNLHILDKTLGRGNKTILCW